MKNRTTAKGVQLTIVSYIKKSQPVFLPTGPHFGASLTKTRLIILLSL